MISPSQKPLPDNTQHSQQTDIHAPAGFEPAIPGSERPQNHALDRAATGIGTSVNMPGESVCRCHTEASVNVATETFCECVHMEHFRRCAYRKLVLMSHTAHQNLCECVAKNTSVRHSYLAQFTWLLNHVMLGFTVNKWQVGLLSLTLFSSLIQSRAEQTPFLNLVFICDESQNHREMNNIATSGMYSSVTD